MLGWKPAQATVVAKRFIQENVGAFHEYMVDVQPVDGGSPFRTTLRRQAFVVGEPEVGDVVPAFCKVSKQTVKFDVAKLRADALAKSKEEPAGWDAAREAAPGTWVRGEGAIAGGTEPAAAADVAARVSAFGALASRYGARLAEQPADIRDAVVGSLQGAGVPIDPSTLALRITDPAQVDTLLAIYKRHGLLPPAASLD